MCNVDRNKDIESTLKSKIRKGENFLLSVLYLKNEGRYSFSVTDFAITLARMNIFWFGKEHLVAGVPLYQGRGNPGPLN